MNQTHGGNSSHVNLEIYVYDVMSNHREVNLPQKVSSDHKSTSAPFMSTPKPALNFVDAFRRVISKRRCYILFASQCQHEWKWKQVVAEVFSQIMEHVTDVEHQSKSVWSIKLIVTKSFPEPFSHHNLDDIGNKTKHKSSGWLPHEYKRLHFQLVQSYS